MSSCESRTCCICKKIFCCAECRKRHEDKKHPNRPLNCPLCLSEKLPLHIFDDKVLLEHIATTHLPLHCCLCGHLFIYIKDLENFGACRWWHIRHRQSIISGRKPQLQTPSPQLSSSSIENKQRSLTDSAYNGNFEASPPVLYRNTSTPMHLTTNYQKDFKTPNAPNFTLKTPKTNSPSIIIKPSRNDLELTDSAVKDDNLSSTYFTLSCCRSSHEVTPFRSVPSSRYNTEQLSRIDSSRNLGVMQEQEEEQECLESANRTSSQNCSDMELTDIQTAVLPESPKVELLMEKNRRRSNSIKRVRFSNQYNDRQERGSTCEFNQTGEFYEARETFSEIKKIEQIVENSLNMSLMNSNDKILIDNEDNTHKENRRPGADDIEVAQQETATSSRVVMMLVLEKNSSLSSADIAPLIDSGLKKLKEGIASTNIYPSTSNLAAPCNSERRSVTAINSYVSVSSIESFSTTRPSGPLREQNAAYGAENVEGPSSGGILSTVTQALKSAFRNIAGAMTMPNAIEYQNAAPQEELSNATVSDIPRTKTLVALPPSVTRPGKRSRDVTEGLNSFARTMDPVHSQIEIRSPLPKRQRGWHRIKAREPISRMRNHPLTSPRGVSSERQVFSQGSLSVGDTVLPLPARAHQSTQTE